MPTIRKLSKRQIERVVHESVARIRRRAQVVVCPGCGAKKRIPASYASHVNGCGRKECRYPRISRGTRIWTPERILSAVRALAKKLGRTPLYKEIEAVVPHRVMQRRFGEVRNALVASGLPMRPAYSGRLTDREWWEKHFGTSEFPPAFKTSARRVA